MARRAKSVSILVAVLALAAALSPAGNAGVRADPPAAYPTIYVKYNMNCTFSIFDDDGKRVSSIAPGTYQVDVSTPVMFKLVVPGGEAVDRPAANDFTGCKGWVQFQLTGPGVDLFTTLDSGCDAYLTLPAQTFKANSTYTAQDLNQPGVTRTAFTTGSATETPMIPKSPYSVWSGKASIFSGPLPLRDELTAKLGVDGKPGLTLKGKKVSSLPVGRYRFAVTDRDPKHGFTVKSLEGKPIDISGTKFVGTKEKIVALTPGRWLYSSGGKAYYFRVTS